MSFTFEHAVLGTVEGDREADVRNLEAEAAEQDELLGQQGSPPPPPPPPQPPIQHPAPPAQAPQPVTQQHPFVPPVPACEECRFLRSRPSTELVLRFSRVPPAEVERLNPFIVVRCANCSSFHNLDLTCK